jgi:hypothetical protein
MSGRGLPRTVLVRLARNPSRIDAKRGDDFLYADFPLLIRGPNIASAYVARIAESATGR